MLLDDAGHQSPLGFVEIEVERLPVLDLDPNGRLANGGSRMADGWRWRVAP